MTAAGPQALAAAGGAGPLAAHPLAGRRPPPATAATVPTHRTART